MVTKARKALRDTAFARKGNPGRKPGPVPLREHPLRFEVALFYLLTQTRCHPDLKRLARRCLESPGGPVEAAELAAAMLHEKSELELVGGGVRFTFRGGKGDRAEALANRKWKIVRDARGLIAGAKHFDRLWLELSAKALNAAAEAFGRGESKMALEALAILNSLGWRERLSRLFAVI
jgi:hypothetical protein